MAVDVITMAILGVLVVNGFVLALAIAYSLRGDLRLVEGFKREPFPKIELRRDGSAHGSRSLAYRKLSRLPQTPSDEAKAPPRGYDNHKAAMQCLWALWVCLAPIELGESNPHCVEGGMIKRTPTSLCREETGAVIGVRNLRSSATSMRLAPDWGSDFRPAQMLCLAQTDEIAQP
jgi:hypothetical protein